MSDKTNRSLDQAKESGDRLFGGFYRNLRLIFRLLKEPRVNFLLKLLPIGALIYLVVPFDFLPFNPIDDALVIWLGFSLFIELCPQEVVQEHKEILRYSMMTDSPPEDTDDVVDGDYRDV